MAENHSFLHRLLNWNKKNTPETVDAEQYAEAFEQFKKLLLEQYQIRIQAKTAKRLPINLSAKPTHFGTSPERAALYFNDLTIESEDIATEIDKILNSHQRLLLIGDPGAGKTTILLFAAINILMKESQEQKLPLILNLATWQKDRDFKEWYAQSIAHTYSLNPVFVAELLRRNAVVPFFDGFDEVAKEAREDCFRNMAAYFGDQRSRKLIVSSRKKEYSAAAADAPVYAEIEVQPLSLEQIRKALTENALTQAADRALLDAIDRDEWLGKAVETPFYLNTASFLFGKGQRILADFPFKSKSTEGRQDELVKAFVSEQVLEEQDRRYLHFLARKMSKENFIVFELLNMQPSWCWNEFKYKMLGGLTYTLASILALGLILTINYSANFLVLILGLSFAIGLSFILGINVYLGSKKRISTADIQTWSLSTIIKNWKKYLFSNLRTGLISCILLGLMSWFKAGLVSAFLVGLSTFGSVILFLGLRESGITTTYLLYLPKPYQRFWATFRFAFWEYPAFLLILGIISYANALWVDKKPIDDIAMHIMTPHFGLTVLSFTSALFIVPLIESQFIEHFTLRFILYLENKIPLRVVTFLDQMTDQHIFEDTRRTINGKKQRGATWRFRHKILQDYFAKMEA